MEFSNAEIFLLVWSVSATCIAVWVHGKANYHFEAHAKLANLLAEVVLGDTTPTKDENDVWTVENDDVRLRFKKRK